jgi:hypothetical protein
MGAVELAGARQRPKTVAVIRRCVIGGHVAMESIRPENTDPIPLQSSPPKMGTIMIRFVGLLIVAIAVLALIWSR